MIQRYIKTRMSPTRSPFIAHKIKTINTEKVLDRGRQIGFGDVPRVYHVGSSPAM